MSDFNENSVPNQPEDKLSTGLTIVSVLVPIVGAILYFVKKEKEPNSAKTACYAALAGVLLGVVLRIILTVLR